MLTIGLYGIPDRNGSHAAHDHAVAFMRNGLVLASVELERYTGQKHDNRLAAYFDDIVRPRLHSGEPVAFVQSNSFLGGTFESTSGSVRLSAPSDMRPEHQILLSELRLSGTYAGLAGVGYTVCHELAHTGTCLPFFGNFRDNSLLVHIDGGASCSSSSAWIFKNGELKLIEYNWNTLKRQTNLFNDNPLSFAILGLNPSDHLAMPGKLMGFASFGAERPDIFQWLATNDWFSDPLWRVRDMREIVRHRFNLPQSDDPTRIPTHWDIAACMQKHFEESILSHLKKLKSKTKARYLYYSGGAALNINTNTRIETELGFEAVHIPPAPSDCGLALGAAAFFEWKRGCPIQTHSPYLTKFSERGSRESGSQRLVGIEDIADRLAAGQIVATCIRDAEIGPRALGHRSMLARPDSIALKRKLSEQMKKREWYRPVAPVMLEEVASSALEKYKTNSSLGDNMLGSWRVKHAFRRFFAGCLHQDATVRAQVIKPEHAEQRELIALLKLLKSKFGIMGLINTSFNEKGKPIVQSLCQAIEQSTAMKVDHLWHIPD